MTFKPDWTLTLEQRVTVALTLALPKHIPGYQGATDEQLEAVAREVLAEIAAENKALRQSLIGGIEAVRAGRDMRQWAEANERMLGRSGRL